MLPRDSLLFIISRDSQYLGTFQKEIVHIRVDRPCALKWVTCIDQFGGLFASDEQTHLMSGRDCLIGHLRYLTVSPNFRILQEFFIVWCAMLATTFQTLLRHQLYHVRGVDISSPFQRQHPYCWLSRQKTLTSDPIPHFLIRIHHQNLRSWAFQRAYQG